MHIGLDFDNTIVSYDRLFHKVATEQAIIPVDCPVNKVAIRDYLRSMGKEALWTEMQGYVYGFRMQEAEPFPCVLDTLQQLCAEGHCLSIISHKTLYPFVGPQYDLHKAAKNWVELYLQRSEFPLIKNENIFFELTKAEKISRIAALACDIFMDDLPEILEDEQFPSSTQALLFDPENHHVDRAHQGIIRIGHWLELEHYVKN